MIYKFDEIEGELPIGGKAKGLSLLHQSGFAIPEFLVITPEGKKEFFENPDSHYSWMSNKHKAVRSSGMREDGENQSFAGQFESFLNLKNSKEIEQAVRDCVASGETDRVKKYDASRDKANDVAVIIQDMVDAKYAGVAFSVDPVTGRRDLSIINLVEGLGDKLVDGKAEPEYIEINNYTKKNAELKSKLASDTILRELHDGLKKLKSELGQEVDVEWAVDQNDKLYWLQVRPITTLSMVHPNELDSKLAHENEILTRANIGEMMPGFLTPLSISTFGKAIEYGIQDFYMQCGVQKEIIDEHINIKFFYNHAFISLTGLYAITDYILLPKNEYIDYSILGRELDKKSQGNPQGMITQILNQIKLFRYFGKAKKRLKKLQEMCDDICQPENLKADELYNWIDNQLQNLDKAYSYHYCTSGNSGNQYTALISVISGGPKPSAESNTYASHFLGNIEGIVGADSIQQLKNLAKEMSLVIPNISKIDDGVLLDTIQKDQGTLGKTFYGFIEEHGHRCVREAEMAEKDWSQDPLKLIPVLRNIVKTGQFDKQTKSFEMQKALSKLPKTNILKKLIIKKLANNAREAVAMREMSKSAAIKFQQKIKFAYIDLAQKLTEKRILEDKSDLFYLTHKEIGFALHNKLPQTTELIKERKQLNSVYSKMNFNEVYYGHPSPVTEHTSEGSNNGTVVSQGHVRGKIKVVRSLEAADKLEKGDIMVCQYTDIGWSPYFAIIGGIITEIGSPLSHGAVVAREYGIPAIVNMHGAMDKFNDNEEVEINTDLEEFIKKV